MSEEKPEVAEGSPAPEGEEQVQQMKVYYFKLYYSNG